MVPTIMKKLLLNFALFLLLRCGHVTAGSAPLNQDNIAKCCYPHDCLDVFDQGLTLDGVYLIYPGGVSSSPVPVYCDMTSDGGPWTVFQKRFDGGVDFYRGWRDYKFGFGRASGEYWLGLQNIFLLTQKKPYRLRIDLEDFETDTRHVTYDYFSISPLAVNPVEDGYKLHVYGFKEGDPKRPAGDSLRYIHNRMSFSTYDHDRDNSTSNCAKLFHGAFWYEDCHFVNLNGRYLRGKTASSEGIVWYKWKGFHYSLKRTEMKIASPVSAVL